MSESSLDMIGLAPRFRSAPAAHKRIATLEGAASADALRPYVLRNEPVVLRGALHDWTPAQRWDDAYLRDAGAGVRVPVRLADGVGDASFGDPQRGHDVYTVEEMEWAELHEALRAAEEQRAAPRYYAAQLRLRTLLPALYSDTRPPPECVGAFGALWRNAPSAYFGCGSRTPLHFDALENLLCIVRGRKRVTLWHPAHGLALYPGDGGAAIFSRIDVDRAVDAREFPLYEGVAQLAHTVELSACDALYLPCGWWHAVRAPVGERSVSVSYWAQQPEPKAWQREERADAAWSDEGREFGGGHVDEACVTR